MQFAVCPLPSLQTLCGRYWARGSQQPGRLVTMAIMIMMIVVVVMVVIVVLMIVMMKEATWN